MLSSARILITALCAGILVGCAQSPAAPPEAGSESSPHELPVSGLSFPYITHHVGEFNGRRVAYTARVEAIDVADGEGLPGARIVSVSYIAQPVADASPRPVMFVFNGGPISPSVYLHMGAFGPVRVAFEDDISSDPGSAPRIENPHALLDVADLVYFDPAGTGFSRALPGKPLQEYFSVAADAQQTAAFIAGWLDAHGRRAAPVYIFGESYGTNRAVETAGQLARMEPPVLADGVVLFGQAVNIIEYAQRPNNIISYVVSLPTLAALGWYHGKAETGGQGLEPFVAEAWDYARSEYLEALFQGNSLPSERMRQVAERLQGFTGLSADLFMSNRLRVSKEAYRVELFKDDGRIIGRSDGRYVADVEPTEGGENSPPQDPARALASKLAASFLEYLVSDLGIPSAEQYLVASPVAGLNDWAWGGQSPFSRFDYGAAMAPLWEQHPEARVLVCAGYYDTMTTIGASQYLVDQEAWPSDRVSLRFYPGGHMAYSIESSARTMAADLRAMMAAGGGSE